MERTKKALGGAVRRTLKSGLSGINLKFHQRIRLRNVKSDLSRWTPD